MPVDDKGYVKVVPFGQNIIRHFKTKKINNLQKNTPRVDDLVTILVNDIMASASDGVELLFYGYDKKLMEHNSILNIIRKTMEKRSYDNSCWQPIKLIVDVNYFFQQL